MKETVFDVLMYLFENYYMDDDNPAEADRDLVHQELTRAGFQPQEIDRAFNWMEGLTDEASPPAPQAERSVRLYSEHEMQRLDTECRGFLLFLEQMGVLDSASRELAIDRAMALENEDFDIEQMKWVIMMVLFNQPGDESSYAWLEDFVFDSPANALH